MYIMEMLARSGQRMSELLIPLEQKYFISGEINSTVKDSKGKMEEIAQKYADGAQERMDGISVRYDTWHFNVRGSNTEPLLRLNLESVASQAEMEAKRDEVLGLIRE